MEPHYVLSLLIGHKEEEMRISIISLLSARNLGAYFQY